MYIHYKAFCQANATLAVTNHNTFVHVKVNAVFPVTCVIPVHGRDG